MNHRFSYFLLSFFLFLATVSPFAFCEESSVPATNQKATSSGVGMMTLANNELAFRVDDFSVTFGELRDYLVNNKLIPSIPMEQDGDVGDLVNGWNEQQQGVVKHVFLRLLRQYLLLREARKADLTVTEEDRLRFAQEWIKSSPEKSFEEYLRQFPIASTDRFVLKREDMYLLLKYTEKLLEEIIVPEAEVQTAKAHITRVREVFEMQQRDQFEAFQKLTEDPRLNTDEGFAELAREVSEGEEALNGGEVSVPMTRAQIAECNYDQPFDVPVGETSALIETPTAYRYIRVLKEIPGELAGEPSSFKIAQILQVKRVMEDPPTDAELEKQIKQKYQDALVTKKLLEILGTSEFECPLFPDLQSKFAQKTENK